MLTTNEYDLVLRLRNDLCPHKVSLSHLKHALQSNNYHHDSTNDLLHICFSYCFTPQVQDLTFTMKSMTYGKQIIWNGAL